MTDLLPVKTTLFSRVQEYIEKSRPEKRDSEALDLLATRHIVENTFMPFVGRLYFLYSWRILEILKTSAVTLP